MHMTSEASLLAELRSFAEMSKRNADSGFGSPGAAWSAGRSTAFRDLLDWLDRKESDA